mgnify:FL=1
MAKHFGKTQYGGDESGLRHFAQAQGGGGKTFAVDLEDCTVSGVSLITANVPCVGHVLDPTPDVDGKPKDPTPLWTDGRTLQEVRAACEVLGQVPVRMDHGSGFKEQIGFIEGFWVDGTQLRGTLVLMKAHKETPLVLEMAERMPKSMGLSVSFVPGKDVKDTKAKKAYARCKQVVFADLVSRPAANPKGLLHAGPFEWRGVETAGRARSEFNIPMNGDPTQQNGPSLEQRLAELEQQNAELMASNEQLQAEAEEADALLKEVVGEQGDDIDGDDPDGGDQGDGLDGGDAGGDAGGGAGGGAVGLAAVLNEIRAIGRQAAADARFVRNFQAELQRAALEEAREEEQRQLNEVAATMRELQARAEKAETENKALRDLAAKTGGRGAAVDTNDRLRDLARSGDPVDTRIRELQEGPDKMTLRAAMVKVREESPEAYNQWAARRRGQQA